MSPRVWLRVMGRSGRATAPLAALGALCLAAAGGAGCGDSKQGAASGGGGGRGGTVAGTGAGAAGSGPSTGGAASGATAGAGGGAATGGAAAGGGGAGGGAAGAGGAMPAAGGSSAAGAGGGLPPVDLSGGVAWEAWPTDLPSVAATTCAVTKFIGGGGTVAVQRVLNETWTYDATTRVLTRKLAASPGIQASTGYARFDAQGRREMICREGSPLACLEWARDAFGNAKGYAFYGVTEGPLDARTLDPAHPPTPAPISGGESETHTLKYDDAGLISRGTYFYPQSGATLTFTRDGQGRCSDVAWAMGSLVEVDHWTFAGGKLASRTVTNKADPTDVRAVMTYGYDADGSLALTAVDGRLDFPDGTGVPRPVRDGVPDYVVRMAKQPDGGRWIELLDFEFPETGTGPTYVTNNATVRRGGVLTKAFRMRWYLSPGCEALALPRHTSQDCEFERPLASMPLGWHNPLVTPIQLWTMTPMPD